MDEAAAFRQEPEPYDRRQGAYLPAENAIGAFNRIDAAAKSLQGPTETRTLTQLRADVLSALLINSTNSNHSTGKNNRSSSDRRDGNNGNNSSGSNSTGGSRGGGDDPAGGMIGELNDTFLDVCGVDGFKPRQDDGPPF